MALVRLEAHGVGPFDDLQLDFSDGLGNSHPGPHIIAGVNGSGKTTALRSIAWTVAVSDKSFPYEDWQHLLRRQSEAISVFSTHDGRRSAHVALLTQDPRLLEVPSRMAFGGRVGFTVEESQTFGPEACGEGGLLWQRLGREMLQPPNRRLLVIGYSPGRALRFLRRADRADPGLPSFKGGLSFDNTVENARVQGWLVDLFSRLAIARQRDEPHQHLQVFLNYINVALSEIAGEPVSLDVSTEYNLQPAISFRSRRLNFSQLPDGVRFVAGLLADFFSRLDTPGWSPDLGDRRPAILLIDEIDAHLHPRWQRTVLPAFRKALPDVQIIVTTHSPFVITSCPGARIHVLDVDDQGRASARPPVDAPIGESINATMKDIFGVSSRFDIQTERDLDRWNELKKKEYIGKLLPTESDELSRLIEELSERSQELRSIVGLPPTVPDSVVQALLSQ